MKTSAQATTALSTVLTFAVATAGCGDSGQNGPEVAVEVIDGVEVATLEALPSPLDSRYLWEWRTVREIPTVTSDTTQPLVYDAWAALPLHDGRLLVHDPEAERPLVVIDLVRGSADLRFGRRGRGPGELGRVLDLAESPEGGWTILDEVNRQLHRFGPDGSHVSSQRVVWDAPLYGEMELAPNSVDFLTGVMRPNGEVVDYDLDVVSVGDGRPRPLLTLLAATAATPVGWRRGRVFWVPLRDGIVGLRAGAPSVSVYDYDGTLKRRISLPLTVRRLDEAEIQARIRSDGDVLAGLEPGLMGLTNVLYSVNDTVFGMFLADLWRAAEDPEFEPGHIYWRMFTIEGGYVGVVEIPTGFRVLGHGPGTIWAQVLNDDLQPVLVELTLSRVI